MSSVVVVSGESKCSFLLPGEDISEDVPFGTVCTFLLLRQPPNACRGVLADLCGSCLKSQPGEAQAAFLVLPVMAP